ncbi:MAG: tautomerase family protein [Clostridiales bacterium]|nr:tautomerase family protein [Candidatus Crickella merdequi]
MPHIDVKMFPGRDEATKKALAEKIIETAVEQLGCAKEVLSVSVAEVTPDDWNEQVADVIPAEQVMAGEVYRVK